MRRKSVILNRRQLVAGTLALPGLALPAWAATGARLWGSIKADVIIAGGGVGGVASALAALRNGLSVVLTEETDWLGGQFTQQGVPADEHPWIEEFGRTDSYASFRASIRDYYRRNTPLLSEPRAQPLLNPGQCLVSRLCHEPRVAVAVLVEMLAPYVASGRLNLLLDTEVIGAATDGDRIKALTLRRTLTGDETTVSAPYFVDATELGDLLPLTGTEHVSGAEARSDTGEPHAAETANPLNQQAFTMCFAVDYPAYGTHTIERPKEYAFWRDLVPKIIPAWPGKLLSFVYSSPTTLRPTELGFDPTSDETTARLNLWRYRRLIARRSFSGGSYASDVSLINWPQNDYMLGPLVGVSRDEAVRNINSAKQLSLSLLYWLQTEAPRADGKGYGYPKLRLRPAIMGTEDGLGKRPYVREARRIRPVFRILEQHLVLDSSFAPRKPNEPPHLAMAYEDSVGVGCYPIDLHPSSGGDNYIDVMTRPFQIPLGALLPVRVENLLPASKNIGTTHVTNGCYRLHPVEWAIGEAVGCLIAFCLKNRTKPKAVHETLTLREEFQTSLERQGIPLMWPWPRQ